MKKNYENMPVGFLKVLVGKLTLVRFLIFSMVFLCFTLAAQNTRTIKGQINDDKGEPMIGATVLVKGNRTIGTVTDIDGKFTLNIPANQPVIVVSYVSYQTKEVNTAGKSFVNIELESNTISLNDVVVVGFGQQKKASVVGSITQATGKTLQRTGGLNNLGAALTGNLPGVVTMETTAKPGQEDPQIIIRGVSSWNGSSPLVLVDGIERDMSSVDITSVENISVLKDASATAVYGVRGANGVILITTKRGLEGKAKVEVGFSATMKSPSKLPGKYDAYDAMEIKNRIVEYELSTVPNGWSYIRPQSFINNYRNQTTQAQRERYPNIDWQKELFKDYAMSYNGNVNVSGGTKTVKYFAALDYAHEGDITKILPNDRGYDVNYAYDRLNTRANLDFQLTKTTTFKVNLFGSFAKTKAPGYVIQEDYLWAGAYRLPPDVFYPKYSDGTWGYNPTSGVTTPNSESNLATGGVSNSTTTRLTTDFALNQDLSILLKGLSAKLTVSLDNRFDENGRGISDMYVTVRQKYIDPLTGIVTYNNAPDGTTNVDYYPSIGWSSGAGSVNNGSTTRNLNYQAQINYGARFGKHNVTAMGNFQRLNAAMGANPPSYREDWVFRTTYNYNEKYFVEYNGAYNGSEKFSTKNRFAFFSSGALGWLITGEKFMKSLKFVDLLKLRASYGQIGDDSYNGGRWLYMDQYNNGTSQSVLTTSQGVLSPYKWNTQTQIGNFNIQWEKVTKQNVGVDFSFLHNLIAGSVDVFHDHRTNVILAGNKRAVPSYFGFSPPPANLGKVNVHGYEIELRINKQLNKDLRLYGNLGMTHAIDKVIDKDDPALMDAFRKNAGFANNQTRSTISHGYYNTWDQLYGSTPFDTYDSKIPGNYYIMDMNADGSINATKDQAPYGYPTNPQNTYNTTLGADYKGFSLVIQFYGVNNVTRYIDVTSFPINYMNTAYEEGTYWSKDNTNPDSPMPRVNNTSLNSASWGTRYQYDGSYIRLKNAELAYTFNGKSLKGIGFQSLRIYLNGNNLWLWTRTPDDREVSGNSQYPLVRRYNLGVRVTL